MVIVVLHVHRALDESFNRIAAWQHRWNQQNIEFYDIIRSKWRDRMVPGAAEQALRS